MSCSLCNKKNVNSIMIIVYIFTFVPISITNKCIYIYLHIHINSDLDHATRSRNTYQAFFEFRMPYLLTYKNNKNTIQWNKFLLCHRYRLSFNRIFSFSKTRFLELRRKNYFALAASFFKFNFEKNKCCLFLTVQCPKTRFICN